MGRVRAGCPRRTGRIGTRLSVSPSVREQSVLGQVGESAVDRGDRVWFGGAQQAVERGSIGSCGQRRDGLGHLDAGQDQPSQRREHARGIGQAHGQFRQRRWRRSRHLRSAGENCGETVLAQPAQPSSVHVGTLTVPAAAWGNGIAGLLLIIMAPV